VLHTVQFESLPQKALFAMRKKFGHSKFTEYLGPDVIGHDSNSACSEREPVSSVSKQPYVPNPERPKVRQLVISEQPLVSRLVPRLRMLRRVLKVLPKSFTICPGYRVSCHIEQLECGHTQTAYKPSYGAKRRNCKACVKALHGEAGNAHVSGESQHSASLPQKKQPRPSHNVVPKKRPQPVRPKVERTFMNDERHWREIAALMVTETDSGKLLKLAADLNRALEREQKEKLLLTQGKAVNQ